MAKDRYEVWQRDGVRRSGNALDNLHDTKQGPTLDGQPVDTPERPLRSIRDTSVRSASPASFVELNNGDVLPGRIEKFEPASSDGSRPHFVVRVDTGASPADLLNETVEVRESAVKRIVSGGASRSDFEPGRVRLHDGRLLLARSVRFEVDGVRCLTDDEVVTVAFDDLRELHLPRSDSLTAVLEDAAWSQGNVKAHVVRIRTTGGAQLTFARSMVQRSGGTWSVRPNWSLNTLQVAAIGIVWFTVRDADEVPLSLLPVAAVRTKTGVHHWPWRRNENVRGGDLQCGTLAADLGVGTHSYCELEFDLPAGATEFTTFVGIDDVVGRGGCVTCRIHRDDMQSPPVWTSGFVLGGGDPLRVGPLNVAGAKRLILVTDFGHDGRPAGADPFDIRDHLDWLLPLVRIDGRQLPNPSENFARWLPTLESWRIADSLRDRVSIRPVWDTHRKVWTYSFLDAPENAGGTAIELVRTLRIGYQNARLVVAAVPDGIGSRGYRIELRADGKPIASTLNGDVDSRGSSFQRAEEREYNLGEFIGREARLSAVIIREGDRNVAPVGVVWRRLDTLPLIDNLPSDGRLLEPDVVLTSLFPERVLSGGRELKLTLTAGQLTDGTPLAIRGVRFAQGMGVPTGTEITYRLDPTWTRFVAVIGLASGSQGAGPYEILLDGQSHWKDAAAKYDRNSTARQIDVAIPAGHERITLRVGGRESFAAWALAGFCKE
ncbi:MAG: NPCBM/NEW2 domain-containing protein [Planctomycetales bacterium]|nr:NPCBM/NEW2 domain-containing protein [Planctomycetales bacterium]